MADMVGIVIHSDAKVLNDCPLLEIQDLQLLMKVCEQFIVLWTSRYNVIFSILVVTTTITTKIKSKEKSVTHKVVMSNVTEHYQKAFIFLIFIILSVCFCFRLFIIITFIHHIIHWEQNIQTRMLFIKSFFFYFLFPPNWEFITVQKVCRAGTWPDNKNQNELWVNESFVLTGIEKVLTKRCKPWSGDGW